MSLSLSDNSNRTIADIRTIQAHGRFGVGNYILLLRLTMLPVQVRMDYVIRNLKLRLDSNTPQGPRTLGWGIMDGTGVLRWSSSSSPHDIFFWIPLSATQIDHLERLRGGGDLNVKVSLYGTVSHADDVEDCTSVSDFVIPQQQWIAALKEMDFADRF